MLWFGNHVKPLSRRSQVADYIQINVRIVVIRALPSADERRSGHFGYCRIHLFVTLFSTKIILNPLTSELHNRPFLVDRTVRHIYLLQLQ